MLERELTLLLGWSDGLMKRGDEEFRRCVCRANFHFFFFLFFFLLKANK